MNFLPFLFDHFLSLGNEVANRPPDIHYYLCRCGLRWELTAGAHYSAQVEVGVVWIGVLQ